MALFNPKNEDPPDRLSIVDKNINSQSVPFTTFTLSLWLFDSLTHTHTHTHTRTDTERERERERERVSSFKEEDDESAHCTTTTTSSSSSVVMNLEEQKLSQPPLVLCPRHPDDSFTAFCPSCLRDRLSGLDPSTSTSPPTRPLSTSSAAPLKATFRNSALNNQASTCYSSNLLELRRCKSFSGGRREGFREFEPQRRSCHVKGRNSLWYLFNKDDDDVKKKNRVIEVENRDLGFVEPVFKQEQPFEEEEIRVLNVNFAERAEEDEEEIVELGEEVKTMKDHIDQDLQATTKNGGRDFKEIAGSFWTAASVFSKKLQKWRRKHKGNKSGIGDGASTTTQVEKPYSEIADYGFGRTSCDIAPRFSLDAARMSLDNGRMSFDDLRASWDEPRASWDGYMIGRMFPRAPPMVSVVEHLRSDDHIPVEEGDTTPGGTAQTRDYYLDSSSSQRRRSLDKSNSIRKKAAAVVAELDEGKSIGNAKVTPASTDIFHGTKAIIPERNLRDLNSNSLRDDCFESSEMGFKDNASIGHGKGLQKSRHWSKKWNIWGLISKHGGNKDDEDQRFSGRNVVRRSLSESWPELRREVNGEPKGDFNRVPHSNSTISSRTSFNVGGSFGSIRRSTAETNGHGKKKREECALDRNRSARYSPNNLGNGLLRFYLTPLRSSRRNGKSRPRTSHSIASSILQLY